MPVEMGVGLSPISKKYTTQFC